MRTRTRTLNETTHGGAFILDLTEHIPVIPGYPATFPYNPRIYQSLSETMTDEEPRLQRSGSCEHSVTRRRIYEGGLSYSWWHSGLPSPPHLQPWPKWGRKWVGSGLYEMYVGNNGNVWGETVITVPSTFDWGTLSYSAVSAMRPSLNKDTLLLNNAIAEAAADASSTGRHWKSIQEAREQLIRRDASKSTFESNNRQRVAQGRRPLVSRFSSPMPKGWASRAMGTLRGAAGFNLLYQFTIKPTISDVKAVYDRVKNLDALIKRLIAEADKLQTRHFKCPMVDVIKLPSDIVRQTVIPFADTPGWSTVEETRWEMRPTYHATMRFRYDVSNLRSLMGILRAKLDSFGVSKILPTLWEAIPYSFVVDWFVNIGKMLSEIERAIVGDLIPIQIVDFVHSIKYHYTTRIIHTQGQGPHLMMSDILLKSRDVSYYARRAEMPNLYDALSVRTPSLNQVLLGGSLVVARR